MSRGLRFYEQQFPFPQGASAGPYPRFLTSRGAGLGNYRPNQAFYRGIVNGTSRTLGQTDISTGQIDLTDSRTWLWIAAGLATWWLVSPRMRQVRSRFR